jgi:hypothetical protein
VSDGEPSSAVRRLSPEGELLLRTAGGPEHDAAIRRLATSEGLRWPRLFELSVAEKATLPAVRRLQAVVGRALPEAATTLVRTAAVHEFTMRALAEDLRRALTILAGAGIEVMLLKGAALAHGVYGDFLQRPMGDIDLLLVDPTQGDVAIQALRANGWLQDPSLPASHYERHHHLAPLFSSRPPRTVLEVHRAPLPEGHPFDLEPGSLIARSASVEVGGVRTRVPSLEDQLLLACLHFGWSHYLVEGGSWRTCRDVSALAAQPSLSWDSFAHRARQARAASVCYWVLRLSRALVGAPVPPRVLAVLRPRVPGPVLGIVERAHVACILPTEFRAPSVGLQRLVWTLGMQPGRSGHGRSRPWHTDEVFIEHALASAPERAGPRGAGAFVATASRTVQLLSRIFGRARVRD